jgi:hypothetical protein
MARLGQYDIDDVIACIIRDETRRIGGAEWMHMAIAGAESGWDPLALGDNGRSFGLFQLYIDGGQGSPWRDHPEVLFNPRFNTQIALPPIAQAEWIATARGYQGERWIRWVCVNSGHPGPVDLYDYRVTNIFNTAMKLIFKADGSWAPWPTLRPEVCAHVKPDDPWGPGRPSPTP